MFKDVNQVRNQLNTKEIMTWVLVALIPAVVVKTYIYGWGSLIQVCAAIFFVYLFEFLAAIIFKMRTDAGNVSSAVTAVILGLCIATYTDWYVIAIASFFAVIVAKVVYGGLGNNIFNPAMVGYLVVLVSFTTPLLAWGNSQIVTLDYADFKLAVKSFLFGYNHVIAVIPSRIDTFTGATWLFELKNARRAGDLKDLIENHNLIIRIIQDSWMLPIAYFVGGLILLWKRIISFIIPSFVILGFVVVNFIAMQAGSEDITITAELLIGNIIFLAFFIATDPVGRPQSILGQYIFAFSVGALTYVIRHLSNYSDGIAFAIVFCNLLTPTIEAIIRRFKS